MGFVSSTMSDCVPFALYLVPIVNFTSPDEIATPTLETLTPPRRKMRNDQKVPSDRCQRVSSTTWTSSATRTPEIQKSVALSPHRSHLWLSSLLARLLFGIALLSSLNCQRSKTVKLKKLYGRKLPINVHFRNDSTVIHDLI
jgi:hypothetical protein